MYLASIDKPTIHDVTERPLRGDDINPRFEVFFNELGREFTHYNWEEECWPKFEGREIKRWLRLPSGEGL
jgi:hypothetical protein